MLKKFAIVAGALSVVTAVLVLWQLSANKATLDVAAGRAIFERYPYWQVSALQSREVIVDPGIALAISDRRINPETESNNAFFEWQNSAQQDVILEFGLNRLGSSD